MHLALNCEQSEGKVSEKQIQQGQSLLGKSLAHSETEMTFLHCVFTLVAQVGKLPTTSQSRPQH